MVETVTPHAQQSLLIMEEVHHQEEEVHHKIGGPSSGGDGEAISFTWAPSVGETNFSLMGSIAIAVIFATTDTVSSARPPGPVYTVFGRSFFSIEKQFFYLRCNFPRESRFPNLMGSIAIAVIRHDLDSQFGTTA